MDRICPFLALAADDRTAVDGYDPDHACHALTPAAPLDRARQSEQCLSEAHRHCDRYLAFLASHAADAADVPTPAPDALIARTRLVVDPEVRRMSGVGAGEAPLGMSPRRWAVAGGVALVGVAAAATAVAGGFSGGPAGPPGGTSQPSASPSATALPTQSAPAEPTTEPTASAPPEPTPKPSRSSRPTATPAPTTYVVQEGDTLNGIAAAFGTTVEAIRQANGLAGDVINIGQVLIIP